MRVRGEIHDLQLHIVWLNYVDLEIIAEERRSLTSFLDIWPGSWAIISITSDNGF